jgi:ABC-type multidrug transport system fused ATPase/permease subunit
MGFMAATAWRALPVGNRLVEALAAMRTVLPYLGKAAELIALERSPASELLPLDATLAENVALSRWGERVDRDRARQCCRMAALDFVDDLEQGMDTLLGDRGTRLSGGQAQRVAIARALYSEPDLIIFDEATSSLDMKNEKAIYETILSLRSTVTMVIIAHRLTTVEGCDSIVWMERGEAYKAGSAADVLPKYREALQQSGTNQENDNDKTVA